MRKADYAHLAAILARHYREAKRADNIPCMETCRAIAREFVRVASVDRVAFLKACGLE